jgi:hypothetical protein
MQLCTAAHGIFLQRSPLSCLLPQVAAFQMLTGWPQEDLLDALGGTQLEGGALFARLEEVLGGPLRPVQVGACDGSIISCQQQ